MVQEGLKNIASGANPMELKKGMEAGLAFVLEKLSSRSISLSGSDIQKVATVSAGGDEEIGSIISKAMDIVTSDGVITCLLYTSPSPRDRTRSRMPSSA